MGIGKRIKEARENLNYTQEELALKIGITKGAIANYENEVSHPKEPILYKLLEVLNVDANFLFQDEMKTNAPEIFTLQEKECIYKYRELDIYGKKIVDFILNTEYERANKSKTIKLEPKSYNFTDEAITTIKYYDTPVSAGTGQYLDNDSYIKLDLMETPPEGAEFVVRVCGDSMEPTYKDGDKLYIEPMEQVEKGEIGIFSVNGDVFVKECGAGQLISHNPKYKPIPLNENDNVYCFGKVVGTCLKYR